MRCVLEVNALGNRALIWLKPSEQHAKCLPELSAQRTGGGKIHMYIRYCPHLLRVAVLVCLNCHKKIQDRVA